MDRISGVNTTDIGGGRRGFRDRNLSAGIPGTGFNAAWFNGIQEETLAVIEGVGIATSSSSNALLWQALLRLTGRHVATLVGNTTLTPDTAGCVMIDASAGNVAATLPAANAMFGAVALMAVNVPQMVVVTRLDSSANAATVQVASGDSFAPGSLTSYALLPGEAVVLESVSSSAWRMLNSSYAGLRSVAFGASSSWTPPVGVLRVRARLVGGGGGGAACNSAASGGGGGAGGYCEGVLPVVPGTAYTCTVGAGGAGGSGSNGANGSASSFGGLSASGGLGGFNDGSGQAGGGGGVGSGGLLTIRGGVGGPGCNGALGVGSGGGGASYWGGGGEASSVGGAPIQLGQAQGSGGGGGFNANGVGGGAGASGLIVIDF